MQLLITLEFVGEFGLFIVINEDFNDAIENVEEIYYEFQNCKTDKAKADFVRKYSDEYVYYPIKNLDYFPFDIDNPFIAGITDGDIAILDIKMDV